MPKAKSKSKGRPKGKINTSSSPSSANDSGTGPPSSDQPAGVVEEVLGTEIREAEIALTAATDTDSLGAEVDPTAAAEMSDKRKTKKSCRLQSEQEEASVLEWVEENPCLWNMKNKDFKNKSKKDRLWQEKAEELGYDVEKLKTWYTDLRDFNTKLHAQKSGDSLRELTERERWIVERFMFLRANIRHRRAPVKSVKEALAVASGDLDEAERIAAEDRLAMYAVDRDAFDGPAPSHADNYSAPKAKRQKRDDGSTLTELRKQFSDAQAELASLKNAVTAAEPITERTAFFDWVRQVCKCATEDQFLEFQTTFNQMQLKWKQQNRQQQRMSQLSAWPGPSATTGPSTSTSECSDFQPMPSQWRMPPPQLQDASPWQSQSAEFMQTYMQQPFLNQASQMQQAWIARSPSPVPVTRSALTPSSASAASTSAVISSALLNLDNTPSPGFTTSLNLSAGSMPSGLGLSSQDNTVDGDINTPSPIRPRRSGDKRN